MDSYNFLLFDQEVECKFSRTAPSLVVVDTPLSPLRLLEATAVGIDGIKPESSRHADSATKTLASDLLWASASTFARLANPRPG
jgi:hypothetical protein